MMFTTVFSINAFCLYVRPPILSFTAVHLKIERDNVLGSCKYETQNRFTHCMNSVARKREAIHAKVCKAVLRFIFA